MTDDGVFGFILGLIFAATLAGWMWLTLTEGSDSPLTLDEAQKIICEEFKDEKNI